MKVDRKVNVLLVDDQPGKLLSYEVMLAELDENLLMAQSAQEALEILLKNDVAVILVDVCMPEFDGFELARMIREHPRYQRTAIIFISAIHISEADSLRGYSAGAVDYVPVPVVPEVLRAKVRVFAELFRKTRLLEELNRELETRVAERTAALESSTTRLLESERGRSLALAAGNMGSWEYTIPDERFVLDEGQRRIFGFTSLTKACGPPFESSRFHPEDWERFVRALKGATSAERTFQAEMRVVRDTGEIRWCLVTAAVSFDLQDAPQRVSGVTVDITERKEAERKQALLAREVDHRARNALAVVQAIVRLGRARTTDEYILGVEGRVRALARTHELLSLSRWHGADLKGLIEEEFAPYQGVAEPRARLCGPSVILPPDKAQSIALIVHELATNAAKYGALSGERGLVNLEWRLSDGALRFSWVESGGPPASEPTQKGFGAKIIDASLNRALGDTACFRWRPEGLRCEIRLVLSPQREDEYFNLLAQASVPTGRPRILVVEDEGLVGALTSELIDQMGYAALGPCVSMDQALRYLRGDQVDGAILDVNLGGELVFPLAKELSNRDIPLVFLTGYEKNIVGAEFDVFPVLQKPVAVEELKAALLLIADPGRNIERGPAA